MRNTTPIGYPGTTNSGIYDAQAFYVGSGTLAHKPAHYPNGRTVVAVCGVYGYTAHTTARWATWAGNGVTCPRCNAGH
jgi:hypothetical protein